MNVNSLEAWLDIATRGLCDAAKERVRAEVNEHFNAAYTDVSRDGLTDGDATTHALALLGDPNAAYKRFNALYLSAGELNVLKGVAKLGQFKHAKALAVLSLVIGAALLVIGLTRTGSHNNSLVDIRHILQSFWMFALSLLVLFGRRNFQVAIGICMSGFTCLAAQFVVGAFIFDGEDLPRRIIPALISLFGAVPGTCFLFLLWPKTFKIIAKLNHKHNRDIIGI